jgi:hypothetical protein
VLSAIRECRIWQGYFYRVALTPEATEVYLAISLPVLIPQPCIPFPIDLLLYILYLFYDADISK